MKLLNTYAWLVAPQTRQSEVAESAQSRMDNNSDDDELDMHGDEGEIGPDSTAERGATSSSEVRDKAAKHKKSRKVCEDSFVVVGNGGGARMRACLLA